MDTYKGPDFSSKFGRSLASPPDERPLQPAVLTGIDQFHAGGASPVERLLTMAPLEARVRVVDVGAGPGGPARLAALCGAEVLGIDRTEAYVAAANKLRERCGPSERVRFRLGDMTPLDEPDASADAVLLIHAQVNLADKARLLGEVRRVLWPGRPLLSWEICSESRADLDGPMPWSLDGSGSHLPTEASLRDAIEHARLKIAHWENRTEWARGWFSRLSAEGSPKGPSLPGLLHMGLTRIQNLGRAVARGTVTLIEGMAHA